MGKSAAAAAAVVTGVDTTVGVVISLQHAVAS